MVDGEKRSRSAEAGKDLVGDQEGASDSAGVGQLRQPSRGRQQNPLPADDRLDDGAADGGLAVQQPFDLSEWATEGEAMEVVVQVLRERVTESRARSGGQGTEGQAVVARLEGEHPGPPGGQHRGLESHFHRVGT